MAGETEKRLEESWQKGRERYGRGQVRRRRVLVRRLLRRLAAAVTGGVIAWSCPRLPEEFRPACSVLVELAGVFHVGG